MVGKRHFIVGLAVLVTAGALAVGIALYTQKSKTAGQAVASTPPASRLNERGFYTLEGSIYSNASAVKVNKGSCVIFWSWRDHKDYLRVCPGDGLVHLNKVVNLHPLNETKTWNDWISDYRFENQDPQTEFVLYRDNPFQVPQAPFYFTNPQRQ